MGHSDNELLTQLKFCEQMLAHEPSSRVFGQ